MASGKDDLWNYKCAQRQDADFDFRKLLAQTLSEWPWQTSITIHKNPLLRAWSDLHNLMAKQLSISLWRVTGSETHCITKILEHFSGLQGSHYLELLTLARSCHCSCLHYCFRVGCSSAHGNTMQIAQQSCIPQEASKDNCESGVWPVFCSTQA